MGSTCHSFCDRIAQQPGPSKYKYGMQWCKICCVWLRREDCNGVNCPCCGMKMRAKPRVRRYKEGLVSIERV